MSSDHGSLPRMRGLSLERTLPLLMTALLLLVIGAALVVSYREIMRSSRVAAAERLRNSARDLASALEASTKRIARELPGLARDSVIRRVLAGGSATPDEVDNAIRRVIPTTTARHGVALWTASGDRAALVRLDPAEIAASAVQGVIPPRGDSVRYGPLYVTRGEVFFWLVSPIVDGRRTIGWIAERRPLGSTPEAQQQIQGFLGRDVTLYFRNDTGTLWTTVAGTRVHPPADTRLDGGIATRVHTDRPELGRVIAADAAIPGTPWSLALERPLSAVSAGPRASLARLALFYLALLVAAGTAVWAISRWLTRPLIDLTRAAAAVGRGDYAGAGDALVARGGEVGQLATSFNHMAAEVSATHAELEQQVEEAQSLSEELEQTNADLQESTRAAEQARDVAEAARAEAEHANRAKSQFLAMMSHELRTPLNAIAGYAELLQLGVRGPVSPDQHGDLERIRRNQRALLTLIDDLLSFARIEAGRMEYHFEDVALDDVLADAEALIAPQARAKGIAYSYRSAGAPVHAWADRQKLERVVLNLLSNAVKFTDRGGRITLTAEGRGGEAIMQVTDTGCGIAEGKQESIFEPFMQAESGLTRSTEGTGLGLAISRELARAMGGDVTVESVEGHGATFTVCLPVRPCVADVPRSPTAGDGTGAAHAPR